MAPWTENKDGPPCSRCGKMMVVKKYPGGRWLALCLFHTVAEGAYIVLPDEKPEDFTFDR